MKAIVTGAGGLVGRALLARIEGPAGLRLGPPGWAERIAAADFGGATVFHLAARVHRADGREEAAFEHDNVQKTLALARAAVRGGANAFVFASTVKVNGEETGAAPFRATDVPAPRDAYARSKWAAEQGLAKIARESGLPVSIVRAPLVFGRDAKANLRALLRLCDSPWPLPFGAIDNRRSFIAASDLARLLVACVHHERGNVATYMAAHPQPFATPHLVATARRALGRKPRLFAMPASMLEAGASLLGRRDDMRRLTRSLQVDAGETDRALGWRAEVTIEAAVAETVAGYRGER